MGKEDFFNLNNSKDNVLRKILIYGAAIFLIFVIGVIIFAIVSNYSNQKSGKVLPFQNNEKSSIKKISKNKENNVSNTAKAENTNVKENKQNNTQNQNALVVKNNIQAKTQMSQSQNQIKSASKIETEKDLKKSEIKQKYVKYTPKYYSKIISQKYYIQVAAFLKHKYPNKKFLELLKKYGYKYTIYPIIINKNGRKIKVNKLLIGPFVSRNKAKRELMKVKKYITQNAFIFKAK